MSISKEELKKALFGLGVIRASSLTYCWAIDGLATDLAEKLAVTKDPCELADEEMEKLLPHLKQNMVDMKNERTILGLLKEEMGNEYFHEDEVTMLRFLAICIPSLNPDQYEAALSICRDLCENRCGLGATSLEKCLAHLDTPVRDALKSMGQIQ